MNAGAGEATVGQLLEAVTVMDSSGLTHTLPPEQLGFSYRDSRCQREGWLVLAARFRLAPAEPSELLQRLTARLRGRRRTQPLALASAGSVFKNPPGHTAGELLDRAGLRGLRYGGAEISRVHANFICNLGGATAGDVLWLVRRARYLVWRASGLQLQPEIKLLGGTWHDLLPALVPAECRPSEGW